MLSNTSQNFTVHKNLLFVGTYALVFVAGLILNLIALVVFFCHTKSRSHTIVYMTNLALADLLLISTLPVRIYYYLGFSGLSQNVCEGLGLALLVNMYGSIFLLTCMSFDRCMAVCYPMSSRVKEGRKKAPLVCLGVWILTVGASLPIYLFKKRMDDPDQNSQCFKSIPIYATQPVALVTTLTVGFSIPLTTMLTCSWFLIKAISQSMVAQTDMIDSRKIQRMIGVSLVIFLVCFLPYHIILVLLYFDKSSKSLLTAFRYSLVLACLNAMLDPLAYYFTTETFRNKVDMDIVRKM
ncbi:hypothetical protein AAFF_G00326940 [Aldrovandia affinis]|uniref:G-protein coupled receptors family 1 profile domain-containing protein n=1 Tax=Aldrovandia affinis TaxID=143900 RepID=A0AAD7X0S0_9TELE|nr:hypothetical protein AAFF_G00326940 [Aldrovandia affinis]